MFKMNCVWLSKALSYQKSARETKLVGRDSVEPMTKYASTIQS
jgi:hypothetical protein